MAKQSIKAWGIEMDFMGRGYRNRLGLTFAQKHPEERTKKAGTFVYAIYSNKKDAIHDKAFRGVCKVVPVKITILK